MSAIRARKHLGSARRVKPMPSGSAARRLDPAPTAEEAKAADDGKTTMGHTRHLCGNSTNEAGSRGIAFRSRKMIRATGKLRNHQHERVSEAAFP